MHPFFLLLIPFGVVFFVLFLFSAAAKARRQAGSANKTDTEATVPPTRTAQPAAPHNPAAPAAPRPTVTPRVQTEGRQAAAVYREQYVKKPAAQPQKPVPKPPEPAPAPKAQPKQQPAALSFTGSDALRGVLYAEILGKPKAYR